MANQIKGYLVKSFVLLLMGVLAIASYLYWKPLVTPSFERKEVENIFYSLMDIAETEHGIKSIENLRKPQPIKDFVRSFSSPALFRLNLEKAFAENGFSYSKTLDKVAKDGLTIIMDFDGGVGMVVLLTMPVKGMKRKELNTIFSGHDLRNFKAILDLEDKYVCCPLLHDF